MTLMYSETEGNPEGYVVLESVQSDYDRGYARGHKFESRELNDGRLGSIARPAREVAALDLPAIEITPGEASPEQGGWRRGLVFDVPAGQRYLQLTVPPEVGLQRAWVNGLLALDTSANIKQERRTATIRVIYPVSGPLNVDLLTASPDGFTAAAVTWHDLPGVLTAPFMGNWPDDARPAFYGPRAEKIQEFPMPAAK
jgi:hypothetical protein